MGSPDGRVFQVEYAGKAVENSGTSMAICCKDGVIFAVEKFLNSKMLVPGTIKRTCPVSRTSGIAVAGMLPDARQLVARARSEANQYLSAYAEDIPPEILAEASACLCMPTHCIGPSGHLAVPSFLDVSTRTPRSPRSSVSNLMVGSRSTSALPVAKASRPR